MVFKTRRGFVYFGRHCAFMFDGHYFHGDSPFAVTHDTPVLVAQLAVVVALIAAIVGLS